MLLTNRKNKKRFEEEDFSLTSVAQRLTLCALHKEISSLILEKTTLETNFIKSVLFSVFWVSALGTFVFFFLLVNTY